MLSDLRSLTLLGALALTVPATADEAEAPPEAVKPTPPRPMSIAPT